MTVTDSTVPTDESPEHTLDIEVLYVRGGHTRDADPLDPESDLFELARDLTACGPEMFERREITPEDAIEQAHVSLGTVEIDATPFGDVQEVLAHVYDRCQGGGQWGDGLYGGSEVRSMQVGDVIVVGMVPYMVAPIGFEELDADLEPDASEFVKEGEYVWIEREPGSLKGATVVETDGPFVVVETAGVRNSGREQLHVDELAVPRHEAGADVVLRYESVYSDGRVEKRGTITAVRTSGRGFGGYVVDTEGGDTLTLGAGHGPVRSRDADRKIGTRWELTAAE